MIYLTTKECAELKKCTVRYIQKLVKENKLDAISDIESKHKRILIPLSELTEAEQLQYYKKHDMELPKELQKPKAKPKAERSTDIESYSENQREEIVFWSNIMNEWKDYCIDKPSKTQATKDFAATVALV